MLHESVARIAQVVFSLAILVWVMAGVRLALAADWTGMVICCVGLLGTVMIVSSLHSRSRRSMYSGRE